MNNKKIIFMASVFAIASLVTVAGAQMRNDGQSDRGRVGPLVRNVPQGQLIQSISIQERKPNGICSDENACPQAVSANVLPSVVIKAAKVTAKSADALTISVFNFTYTVRIQTSTQMMRRAGGASNFDEISVGDVVNVQGSLDSSNFITASAVRNISVQAQAVIHGIVSSVATSTSSFLVASANNGDYTVAVSSSTKYIIQGSCELFSNRDGATPAAASATVIFPHVPCQATSTVGSFSNIAVKTNVTVRGNLSGKTMNAMEIVINPAFSANMKRNIEGIKPRETQWRQMGPR